LQTFKLSPKPNFIGECTEWTSCIRTRTDVEGRPCEGISPASWDAAHVDYRFGTRAGVVWRRGCRPSGRGRGGSTEKPNDNFGRPHCSSPTARGSYRRFESNVGRPHGIQIHATKRLTHFCIN
jgi:hypothetical protein